MKVFFLVILGTICFESTHYDFLNGLTKEEIRRNYLGLHDDYLKDTMLSMFMTSSPEYLDTPESFDWT